MRVRAGGFSKFQVCCYYEVFFAPTQLRCCSALKVEFTTHSVKLEHFSRTFHKIKF